MRLLTIMRSASDRLYAKMPMSVSTQAIRIMTIVSFELHVNQIRQILSTSP